MNSKIIIFSGLDGCGKSTQISMLSKYLNKSGIKYKIIWSRPGSTPFLMLVKSLARFIFRSLPSGGRSEKRDLLLRRSFLGKIWFYISLIELLYIYNIHTHMLRMFGYTVIFDRHLIDSIIDYKITLRGEVKYLDDLILLCPSSSNVIKIYLTISLQESVRRCQIKWEPFPDTYEEKMIRLEYYDKFMLNQKYAIINGLSDPIDIHESVLKLTDF